MKGYQEAFGNDGFVRIYIFQNLPNYTLTLEYKCNLLYVDYTSIKLFLFISLKILII